jgi:cation transport regulator ChaB
MKIATVNDLPTVITEVLPFEAQQLFVEVYNREISSGFSDALAFEIAWTVIKSKFKLVEGYWVAMSQDFIAPEFYTFELSEEDTKIVMNSDTEEIIMEAILADNTYNNKGEFFEEEDLQAIAAQINAFGSTLPDVDHEKLQSLVTKYGNNIEAIRGELQKEKGIFKKITAIVEKGKLWIQAALDKRYKNHTDKFKKLSIEAYGDKDRNTGRIKNPIYMGFTFTNKARLANAKIVSVTDN